VPVACMSAIIGNRMNRQDFDALWIDGKSIVEDITFIASTGYTDVFSFDDIEILTPDVDLRVSGTFSCRSGALAINFVVIGLGPVHRYCLGGNRHGESGRYHQHIIQKAEDSRLNLPYAVPRDDLKDLSPEVAWQRICQESSITHSGRFFPPEVLCP
jgi:hypothetical protein